MNTQTPIEVASAVAVAPHVLTAINGVTREIARDGIAKDRRNDAQKYSFRGIDDVYNALAPLLAKHSLIIKPRGLGREVTERAGRSYEGKPGAVLIYVSVCFDYEFISAIDGSRELFGPFYGEAMDSGDKATNKAQSAAYKYMAIQAFSIPTEGDNDADATTHEVQARAPGKPGWVTAAEAAIIMLRSSADCDAWYRKNVAMLKAEPNKALRDDVLALLKRQKEGLAEDEAEAKAKARAAEAETTRFRGGGSSGVAGRDSRPADPLADLDDEIPF